MAEKNNNQKIKTTAVRIPKNESGKYVDTEDKIRTYRK